MTFPAFSSQILGTILLLLFVSKYFERKGDELWVTMIQYDTQSAANDTFNTNLINTMNGMDNMVNEGMKMVRKIL